MKRSPFSIAFVAIGGLFMVAFMFLLGRGGLGWGGMKGFRAKFTGGSEGPVGQYASGPEEEQPEVVDQPLVDATVSRIKKELQELVLDLAEGDHREGQTTLSFSSDEEYNAFLKRIAGSGMSVVNKNPNLKAVLVSMDSLNKLRDFLASNPDLKPDLTGNSLLRIPTPLGEKDQTNSSDMQFTQDGVKSALGLTKQAGTGQGVKVAILDSAVAQIPFFGTNLIMANTALANPTTNLEHGTATASLVQTYAPGATIMSYPVVAADGMSDSFTISNAIIQAVNDGAQIINISLGSYEDAKLLGEAIDYAYQRGVAITASAGNEGMTDATYPARNSSVYAVMAGDASGQSATFSNNSSNPSSFTMPGVGVPAVYPDGQFYAVDGTSFSSPLMAAVMANVMSTHGVTAHQAYQMLQSTANDAGAAGLDNSYGNGWARVDDVANASIPNYTDGRMASNHLNTSDPNNYTIDYVVQNNGNTNLDGYSVGVDTNGTTSQAQVPSLLPGQSWSYQVPVQLTSESMRFSSTLYAPGGSGERTVQNNSMQNTYQPKAK